MLLVRPKVKDLVFRLYDRPVHPEFFDSVLVRTMKQRDSLLVVRLTAVGHVIEWHRGSTHLVEMTAEGNQELPERNRLAHVFQGERKGRCTIGDVRYHVNLHAEILPPEVFLHVHDELVAEGEKRGMLHYFAPHRRMALAPLGLVTMDVLPTGLSIATFHTFPSEFAVVKTQSLIESA